MTAVSPAPVRTPIERSKSYRKSAELCLVKSATYPKNLMAFIRVSFPQPADSRVQYLFLRPIRCISGKYG